MNIDGSKKFAKKFVHAYYHKSVNHLAKFLKWTVISVITGIVVGGISTLFAFCMNIATEYRIANDYIILLLPPTPVC